MSRPKEKDSNTTQREPSGATGTRRRVVVGLSALILTAALASSAPATATPPAGNPGTYTLDTHFDEGTRVNLSQVPADQLQLDDTVESFNFIWIAVSTKGTIVKIDTDTGAIEGEYRTAPQGQPVDPSRTTVDLNGSVWAGNRAGNSVVHVGLEDNGQCEDRNSNGVIDTSTGQGDVRGWSNTGAADTNGGVSTAADECIIHYTRINSSGVRHLSVNADNDVWVSGTGGSNFDLVDGDTGAIIRTESSVGYGGYGGLIDSNGVIWSARNLLRWDTANPLTGANGGNWRGYSHDSYGLCVDNLGNVWNTALTGNVIRKFNASGVLLGVFPHGSYYAQGCVADADGDIWVAHSLLGPSSTVGHLLNDGTYVGNVSVGVGPTGMAVDAAGKIWATNYNSRTASRIDPDAGPLGGGGATVGAVDLTTPDLGGNPYNYSDMTGSTLSGAPPNGTWTFVHDSGVPGAEWGNVGWNDITPGDSSIDVTVASSNNAAGPFSAPESVTNGVDITIPDGQFLKVTVALTRSSTDGDSNGVKDSPILEDLTIKAFLNDPPTVGTEEDAVSTPEGTDAANTGTYADPDGDDVTLSADGGAVVDHDDGTWSWSKPAPDGPAGPYTVTITADDGNGETATTSFTVEVTNVAPEVDAGPDLSTIFGGSINLDGGFSDPGTDADWTVDIDWDDDSSDSRPTTGTGALTDGHQYLSLGEHTVEVCVTDKDGAVGCDTTLVTVTNTDGKVTGGPSTSEGGKTGFNVQSDTKGLKGNLQHKGQGVKYHAKTMTALAVSLDRTSAWFAGTDKDGTPFVVYTEDNGEPGRDDVFMLWIDGVLATGDVTGGNVQIH